MIRRWLGNGHPRQQLAAMQSSVEESEGRTIVDLSGQRVSGGVLETTLTLHAPCGQIHVRLPAATTPGRAEAVHGKDRWDAKHFWNIDQETVAFEFDGPLPAGQVRLRVPVSSPT
jgi:hypothetical protein